MNAHSPAPWRIEYSTDCLYEPDEDDLANRKIYGIADANGHSVVSTDSGYYTLPEANARLIAAAPLMLEALRAVESSADDAGCDGCYVVDAAAILQLRTALAKATGGAP